MRKDKANREQRNAFKTLRAIERAMLEDLLGLRDEEILAEAREDGVDSAAVAAALRSRALESVRAARARSEICADPGPLPRDSPFG